MKTWKHYGFIVFGAIFAFIFTFVSCNKVNAQSKLTITNIPDEFINYIIGGGGYAEDEDTGFSFTLTPPPTNDPEAFGEFVKITSSTVTINVYQTNANGTALFKGNITLKAKELYIIVMSDKNSFDYKNKSPVVFSNGSATINFATGLVKD